MFFYRSLLILCLFSVISGAAVFFMGRFISPQQYSGGYVVLATADSVDDRVLLEFLSSQKRVYTRTLYSESTQWVLLDDFSAVVQVPLDEFSRRVMPFDPRNDGYAQMLQNFFRRDGKRFIFMPVRPGAVVPPSLEKQTAKLLGDTPFSFGFFGFGQPVHFFFIAFGAAALLMLVFCYVKKSARACLPGILVCLPVLAALSFFGQAGIALAALLLGVSALLWEPLFETTAIMKLSFIDREERRRRLLRDVYEPYKLYLFFLPLFPLAFVFIAFFSGVLLRFAFAVSVLHGVIFFFSIKIFSLSGGMRKRFRPVLILKRRFPDFVFSLYMLPFALAAVLAVFFAPLTGSTIVSGGSFSLSIFNDWIISEEDFRNHLAFQTSFSTRSLNNPQSAFPSFIRDADGLFSPNPEQNNRFAENNDFGEFPPFPLRYLMNFIVDYNERNVDFNRHGYGVSTLRQRILLDMPLLILFVFILPGFLLKNKPLSPVYGRLGGSGEITGKKTRWGDKNHKKILSLTGNKNTLLARKDA